jgi:hypothetical protein
LAELVENIDEAGRKGRHARCTSQPHKTPSQIDARPPLQKFFRCAGQRLQRLAAHDILHGGRRAEKGGRSERKVQKYAARRGGSGNQGAVAQFSTGRRCGNWQCTGRPLPGEQWLLPLHHSSSGAWLKAMPVVGETVWLASRSHRSLRRLLHRRLFASAPAHAPAAASQVVARRSSPRRAPPDLVALHPRPQPHFYSHLSPPSPPPPPPVAPACRHVDRTTVGTRQWCCVCVPWLCAPVSVSVWLWAWCRSVYCVLVKQVACK